MVRPTLEYACPAGSTSLTLGLQSDVERVQRHAMNIIYRNTPYIEALVNTQLNSLKQRRAQLCEHFFTQIEQPQHNLHKLLPKPRTTTHNTRCRTRYYLPRVKTNRTKNCFINWCLQPKELTVTLNKLSYMLIWICLKYCKALIYF